MSYTRSSAASGETVKYLASESRWYVLSGFLFYSILFLVLAIGFSGWAFAVYVFWIWDCVNRWFIEYAVTDRRVVLRRGIVTRSVREVDLASIEGVDLYQSFWARIFGTGSVSVRGRGVGAVDFVRVGGAVAFKKVLQETIDSRR